MTEPISILLSPPKKRIRSLADFWGGGAKPSFFHNINITFDGFSFEGNFEHPHVLMNLRTEISRAVEPALQKIVKGVLGVESTCDYFVDMDSHDPDTGAVQIVILLAGYSNLLSSDIESFLKREIDNKNDKISFDIEFVSYCLH